MSITDSDHLEFMRTTAQALGRIEAGQNSTLSYLEAVNRHGKETTKRLDDHLHDVAAHGADSRGQVWAGIGKILASTAAVVAIFGGLVALVKAVN